MMISYKLLKINSNIIIILLEMPIKSLQVKIHTEI